MFLGLNRADDRKRDGEPWCSEFRDAFLQAKFGFHKTLVELDIYLIFCVSSVCVCVCLCVYSQSAWSQSPGLLRKYFMSDQKYTYKYNESYHLHQIGKSWRENLGSLVITPRNTWCDITWYHPSLEYPSCGHRPTGMARDRNSPRHHQDEGWFLAVAAPSGPATWSVKVRLTSLHHQYIHKRRDSKVLRNRGKQLLACSC